MRLRAHVGRFIRWLTEPTCTVCRQQLDDCRCDPWWHYAGV